MAHETAKTRIPRTPVAEPRIAVPTRNSPPPRHNVARPLFLVPHRLTPAERHRRISELAYRRAEQRGFTAGNEIDDWLEAEREVDAGRY